jgi:hypothetical protein
MTREGDWERKEARGSPREGKEKGEKRDGLGGTERGHLIDQLFTHGCSTDTSNLKPGSRSPRVHETSVTPSTLLIALHRLASFELAPARPTPAMLSIMLPPLTIPVVAIRNFRPNNQFGKAVLTSVQQMTNLTLSLTARPPKCCNLGICATA